jgi:hypothetical protein
MTPEPIGRRHAFFIHQPWLAAAFWLLAALPAVAQDLPDPRLTPGDVVTTDAGAICRPGYAKSVRHVPGKVKAAAYREYGIKRHRPGEYEVDHLVSLELGGSNDIRNLWPESYETAPWNAHVKDKVENRLHDLVCTGALDLKEAQRAIARNWIAAYARYMREKDPQIGVRASVNQKGLRTAVQP